MENQPPITPAFTPPRHQTLAPAPAEPQACSGPGKSGVEAANAKVKTAEENAANYQKAALCFKVQVQEAEEWRRARPDDDDGTSTDRVVDAEVQARTATAAANAERERRDQLAA